MYVPSWKYLTTDKYNTSGIRGWLTGGDSATCGVHSTPSHTLRLLHNEAVAEAALLTPPPSICSRTRLSITRCVGVVCCCMGIPVIWLQGWVRGPVPGPCLSTWTLDFLMNVSEVPSDCWTSVIILKVLSYILCEHCFNFLYLDRVSLHGHLIF